MSFVLLSLVPRVLFNKRNKGREQKEMGTKNKQQVMEVDELLEYLADVLKVPASNPDLNATRIYAEAISKIRAYWSFQRKNGCLGCEHYIGLTPLCSQSTSDPCLKD